MSFNKPPQFKAFVGRTDKALKTLEKEGYTLLHMPLLIDIKLDPSVSLHDKAWNESFTAPLLATGKTKGGKKVVAVSHVETPFFKSERIKRMLQDGLINHAGVLDTQEFYDILNLEDEKNVFVRDAKKFEKFPNQYYTNIEGALKHPFIIPFFGGKQRAEAYLSKHKEIYKTFDKKLENTGDRITIWYLTKDINSDKPLGRILNLGGYYKDHLIIAASDISGQGQFLGIRSGLLYEISELNLEEIMKAINFNEFSDHLLKYGYKN